MSADEATEVPLVNPQGQLVAVPASHHAAALAQGYTAPNAEQQKLAEVSSKYGEGLGNTLTAAAAGAARGLSFGLSDQALVAGGVDPETLRGLQEQHGLASGVGEAGGIGLGLLATGGLGGAAGAGVRTVARAGELIAEGTEGALAATRLGGAGAGLAQRVLAKGIAKGTGSAVEGAMYGGGHAISENALGDPEALGQGLLAHIGLGAVFGGLGGATLGALGEVASTGTRGIASLLGRGRRGAAIVADEAAGVAGGTPVGNNVLDAVTDRLGTAGHMVAGGDEATWQELLSASDKGAAAREAAFGANDVEESAKRAFTGHINTMEEDARHLMEKSRGGFKTEQIDRVIRKDNVPEQWGEAQKFFDRGMELVNTLKAEKNIYGDTSGLARLEKYLTGYRGRINKILGAEDSEVNKSTEIFQALDDLKRKIGPLAKPGKFPNAHEVETVGAIRNLYSNDLRPLLEKQDVWGGAGEMQRRINEKWTALLEHHALFRKQFMTDFGRTEEDLWVTKHVADPTAIEGYLVNLGRARNDLKELLVSSHIDRIQDFAREMREIFHTDPADAARIANIEKTHGSLTQEIKSLGRRMGLRNEAKKILGTKTGRALAQFAALESTLRAKIEGTPLAGVLRQEMQTIGGTPAAAAMRAAKGTGPPAPGPPPAGPIGRAVNAGRASVAPAATAAGHQIVMGPDERRRAKDRALSTYLRRSIVAAASSQQHVAQLAGIERANMKVNKTIDDNIKGFVDGIGSRSPKNATPASVGAMGRVHLSSSRRPGTAAAGAESYKHRLDELAELTQNPQLMQDRMVASTKGIVGAAPRITGEMQLTAVRAAHFLFSKAPKDPIGAGSINPMFSKWQPSGTELAKFERYMQAVQHPLSVLQDLKSGTVSQEGVESLRAVYPALYNDIVSSLLPKLAEKPDIPFQTRMQLSVAFALPADAMASPAFFASMQKVHAASAVAAGPPKPAPNSKNARSAITETPLQRAVGAV